MNHISDEIQEKFDSNLTSILIYGSMLGGQQNTDVDLIVILSEKTNPKDDLDFLRKIRDKYRDQNIDLQLIYKEEIESANRFSLDTHGSFFLDILKGSKVLYGHNPFINLNPGKENRITSLLNNIQTYTFRARQEYFGIGRFSKDANPLYHQKRIQRVIFDILLMSDIDASEDNAVDILRSKIPNLVSQADSALLSSKSDDIEDYIELYERLYSFALKISKIHIPNEVIKPKKIILSDMVADYLPQVNNSRNAIIFIDGLPRVPSIPPLLNLLHSWGHTVFYPRLPGTWESPGIFLEDDPALNVMDFARSLKDPNVMSKNKMTPFSHVTLIGNSFGGAVALCAGIDINVDQTILLSPVHNFSEVAGIGDLDKFLKNMFPGAYRFKQKRWDMLMRGDFMSPESYLKSNTFDPSRYTVIAGRADDQIIFSRLDQFCEKNKLLLLSIDEVGHLSPSNMAKAYPVIYSVLFRDDERPKEDK